MIKLAPNQRGVVSRDINPQVLHAFPLSEAHGELPSEDEQIRPVITNVMLWRV